jgi:hypothetical protein
MRRLNLKMRSLKPPPSSPPPPTTPGIPASSFQQDPDITFLERLLRIIFPKLTFLSFKFKSLVVLTGALLADFGIKLVITYQNLAFELTGPDIAVALSVIMAFIIAILVDTLIALRSQRLKRDILDFLRDPNVPTGIKAAVIKGNSTIFTGYY